MQSVRMSPEQGRQYTLHSLKATMLSIAKQIDVPKLDRAEQDHHRQHGWRASVRLYSRDDVWGALACQRPVVHKVADGFRPLTGRGAQIPTRSPSRWRLYPTTTAHRSSARGPRRSPKLQTLLATPGDAEAPTEWAVTMSESSALEEDPPTGRQTPEDILYVTNVKSRREP